MARVSTKAPGVVVAAALKKLGATVENLSEAAGIPPAEINAVINGAPITPELSVRLGKALGEKERYFADLQLTSDIAAAAKEVGKIAKLRKPTAKPGRKPAGKKADIPTEKKADAPAGKRGRKPGRKPAESPVAAQTPETLPKKRGRKPGTKVKK